jgi:GGDEF domain-containing protein
MAHALISAVPQAATVARLGGDEFGVLVVGRSEPESPEELTNAVREAMSRYRRPDGTVLSASLGVASSPPAVSVEEAAHLADLRAGADKSARRANRR